MLILFILGLMIGAFLIIFVAQNITPITVIFLTWNFHGSLALILVFAVVGGILLCAFLSLPDVIKSRFQISELKHGNNELKEKLARKEMEVQSEKSKLDANNAYLDDLEKDHTDAVLTV